MVKTLEDAVKRHEFQIVLVGPDAEVGGAGQSFRDGLAIGNKHVRRGA
jgi:hypothetical protein